jgi:hypothetical protein
VAADENNNNNDEENNNNNIGTSGTTTTSTASDPIQYYVNAREDRSGRQLLHFLKLDAYAYAHGGIVGGQCPHYEAHAAMETNVRDTQEMLEWLGMDTLYKYKCPTEQQQQNGTAIHLTNNYFNKEYYFPNDFTEEWRDDLRRRFAYLYPNNEDHVRPHARKKIAVHVRRGDITPCAWRRRYLSNIYYLKAIHEIVGPEYCQGNITQNCDVTIYTEPGGVEPLEEFLDAGYNVNVGSTLGQVVYAFMTADVLFAGTSSFSYAPSVLNRGTVILPERGEFPSFSNFHVIPPESPINQAAKVQRDKLTQKHCNNQRRHHFRRRRNLRASPRNNSTVMP